MSTLGPSNYKVLVLFFLPAHSVLLAGTIREGEKKLWTGHIV